ncbi:MAG TPA: thioredoxin domain-containing protein [archaeon]|nr:thioredoxin domain-containing protein [archaeon]
MKKNSIYITLTDANFQREALENPQPVLVLFEADWSGSCHIISSIIESLAADFKGQIRFAKLDVDVNVRITKEYGIRTLPTLIFFKNGQVVDHIVGVISEKVLVAHLSALLQTE